MVFGRMIASHSMGDRHAKDFPHRERDEAPSGFRG
jgi:hypothetical protein